MGAGVPSISEDPFLLYTMTTVFHTSAHQSLRPELQTGREIEGPSP